MKKFLLSVGLLFSAALNAQDCSDLFISEYVEGWSNNKALEIYNPTDQAIDLSNYVIMRYSNGSTTAGATHSVQLSGMIEPNDVYVAVIDKQDPNGTGQDAPVWEELQAKADGFYCPVYNVSSAMYFNGNDAIVLARGSMSDLGNTIAVDIFGKIGQDPDDGGNFDGWTSDFPYTSAGVVITTDHSMIRKSNILKGETNPGISHFNPLGEWDSIPPVIEDPNTQTLVGNWETLGSHECDCANLSTSAIEKIALKIYPNPSSTGVFTIESEEGLKAVNVINALGQSVYQENELSTVAKIELAPNRGVYFINIETINGSVITRKVIIK
jgi:hypothetical protein